MDNIILQKTWVQGCPVIVDNLLGTAFTGEAQAHTFVVSGVDAAQEPVTITGTITGKFLAANNVTVPLTGTLVNGAASVTLTDECYDVPGRYILSIYATNGSTTQCLYCAVGNVFRTDSQTIAYPSTDLPNITTLMAQLEEILDGWPADYSQLQSDVSNLKSAINGYAESGNIGYAAYQAKQINSNGTIGTSGAYVHSDFIEVPDYAVSVKIGNSFYLGSTKYYLGPGCVFFDSSKNVLSSGTGVSQDYATYTLPENTKYIRFNQANTANTSVNNAITGFWFVSNLKPTITAIQGDNSYTATFTASQQVKNSGIAVKAGVAYTISLIGDYTPAPSAWSDGRINIFSNGTGHAKTLIFYADSQAMDFVPDVDGDLCFYNYGGYTGSVSFNVHSALERAVDDTPIVYRVATQLADYTSLSELLLDLKNDKREKTIIIEGGDYNIFSEYRALQTAGKLPQVPTGDFDYGTGYVPYNVFIPDNTHIIGQGLVRLLWQPTSSDITANESKTWSPINVAGSMTLENVEIHCKNGRYCIHDDPLQDSKYNGAIKKYINVKCVRYTNDTGLGFDHCFGCGIARAMTYTFENCTFENKIASTARTFYFHDRATVGGVTMQDKMSSRIIANNCSFLSADDGVYAVYFGNIGAAIHIRVDLNNCYTNKAIVAADEGSPTSGNNTNSFDITARFCKYAILVVRDANNPYPPAIYAYT